MADHSSHHRRKHFRRLARNGGLLLALYLVGAYFALPLLWKLYDWRDPTLEGIPRITSAADGIPGDPLNVELIGSDEEVHRAMRHAKWYPADPLSLRDDLKIATDTVLERSYTNAPVSNLFLFGRKEDLAFEAPVGDDPSRRHHVRFWSLEDATPEGRKQWIGSASFDRKVGFSHRTGEITHHIEADVDAERDGLFHDLESAGELSHSSLQQGFHKIRKGHNGGGDPWFTDGGLRIGVIIASEAKPTATGKPGAAAP